MNNKKINILLMVIVIVLIGAISFLGLYINGNNLVKEITFGKDLIGERSIKLAVDTTVETVKRDENGNIVTDTDNEETEEKKYTQTSEPVNPEEVLTLDNYKKAKNIVLNRMEYLGANDYTILQNEENGDILITLPENENTSYIYQNITGNGKFEIIDKETNEILMDNSDIKNAEVQYTNSTNGTSIYLIMNFNDSGKEKLSNISQTYIKTTEIVEEDGESKEEEKTKYIEIKINDETFSSTYFGEAITNGILPLSVGQATNNTETLNGYLKEARSKVAIINSGLMPIVYISNENKYVFSEYKNIINEQNLSLALLAFTVLISIYMLKYRKKGIITLITNIGFLAIFLLIIRYTNVELSIEGILAMFIGIILNTILEYILIINKNEDIKEEITKYIKMLIPILIISIISVFRASNVIASLGMVLFWAILVIIVYNFLYVKPLLKNAK